MKYVEETQKGPIVYAPKHLLGSKWPIVQSDCQTNSSQVLAQWASSFCMAASLYMQYSKHSFDKVTCTSLYQPSSLLLTHKISYLDWRWQTKFCLHFFCVYYLFMYLCDEIDNHFFQLLIGCLLVNRNHVKTDNSTY